MTTQLPTLGSPLPVRSTPPLCMACAEGDHEMALRAHERCTCPCHGMAMPEAVAA
jgi:hypothetical protein